MDERRERDPDTGKQTYVGSEINIYWDDNKDRYKKLLKKLRQRQLKKKWGKLGKLASFFVI